MKTITETCRCCDRCDYKFYNSYDAEMHYARNHSCLKQISINDHWCLYFETKENAELWLKHYNDQNNTVYWDKPGWYCLEVVRNSLGRTLKACLITKTETKVRVQNQIQKLQDELKQIEGLE